MPAAHELRKWRSHILLGTVDITGNPAEMTFHTMLDSPETYNGRTMRGRIVEVSLPHEWIANEFIKQFVTKLRESGSKLPDTMG